MSNKRSIFSSLNSNTTGGNTEVAIVERYDGSSNSNLSILYV
jgi:hypothetical protein